MQLRNFVFKYVSPFSNRLEYAEINAVSGQQAELELKVLVPCARNVSLVPAHDYSKILKGARSNHG